LIRLTDEQLAFANHVPGAFLEACPGAGKTRAIVARIVRIAPTLPSRRGVAILSFTNSAIEEFTTRCHTLGLDSTLHHPGFIGTFDAFLRQFFFSPHGVEGVAFRPTVVDCWDTLGVEIRLRGPSAFPGDGASLDLFDAENSQIEPSSIGHPGLRAHVQNNRAAYQQAAALRRCALRLKGYVSAADVRIDVVRLLQRSQWSIALGRALAARFHEVIVDEAQDCNPLDCQIIRWLRKSGISVSVVADPDQAIYGFRHGSPAGLQTIAEGYNIQDRLRLTGNFRSSPAICGIASTLRSRQQPDRSLGETSEITEPVHIVMYQGATVSDSIGRKFCQLMQGCGVAAKDGLVLAHARRNALRACGSGCEEESGNSKTAGIARAVGTFWSSSVSTRARESALLGVEKCILDLLAQIDHNEAPGRAAERHGIDVRWLRSCGDTNADRTVWISALREEVARLGLAYRPGVTERQYFQNRADANWHRLLVTGRGPEMGSSTIHEAKGKEYEAVCVVIPPDQRDPRRTEQLFASWINRTDEEAKRVIYVGITRAKRLVVIAVPVAFRDRLTSILESAQVPFSIHAD
jgi:DNA helicase-2/ATP-dependent DNA helicase PcrA